MARAALRWGVRELAGAASVSPDTIARIERGEELRDRTVAAIRQAFEAAGVDFTNGDRPGVRLMSGFPRIRGGPSREGVAFQFKLVIGDDPEPSEPAVIATAGFLRGIAGNFTGPGEMLQVFGRNARRIVEMARAAIMSGQMKRGALRLTRRDIAGSASRG